MRQVSSILAVLAVLCSAAAAQSSSSYFFAGPGASSNGAATATLQLGGGMEAVLGKGIGIGGELGALGPTRNFSDLVGVFSANGYYHLARRENNGRADPYLTGGYSLFFRSGSDNLFNLGAGVNYWVIGRIGVRLEIRDHIRRRADGAVHFYNFRIGLAVR